jgi:hypothetical protein
MSNDDEDFDLPGEAELDAIAIRIDSAADGLTRASDIREQLGGVETPIDEAIVAAFSYFPRSQDDGKADGYFRPLVEYEVGSNPPPVHQMPEWVHQLWEECATRVTSAAARARLHDLCFEAKRGDGREHARKAAEAYIELGELYPSSSEIQYVYLDIALGAGRNLGRALELTRLKGLSELADQAIEALARKADYSLNDDKAGPGVVLRLIRPLANDREGSSRSELLLMKAREKYKDDVFNTLSVTEIQLNSSSLDEATSEQLRREEVQALLDAAEQASPIASVMHLEDAAQRARQYGLRDLLGTATLRLQNMSGVDIGLVPIESKIEIPVELVRAEIDDIVGDSTWQDALERLVMGEPPSRRIESNRQRTFDLQASSPLVATTPVSIMGRDGLVRKKVATDDAIEEFHLSQIEVQSMQLVGSIRIEALKKIADRFGPIDETELAAFLSHHGHVPAGVARAIARAFGCFFTGDFEGAGLRAVPRIERVAREILLKMKAPVFRPPFGTSPGQYSGLGVMLDLLHNRGLDESWFRFLISFLTRPEGLNFRNELLHGSEDDVDQIHAGLALIALLYLCVAVQVAEPPNDSDSI